MNTIRITTQVDDAKRMLVFAAEANGFAAEAGGPPTVVMSIGGRQIAKFTFGSGTDGRLTASAECRVSNLLGLAGFEVKYATEAGGPIPDGLQIEATGQFFEAIALKTRDDFINLVQAHHSRYRSQVLLELAARSCFVRFTEDFVVRMGAQVIIGHRMIERFAKEADEFDRERAHEFVTLAREEVRLGCARVAQRSPLPDWHDVRWTVSLGTVAGYLAMVCERYDDAAALFEANVGLIGYVEVSKVSALNFVLSCLYHGLLSDFQGQKKLAKASLLVGLSSTKPMVQAQNLFENVWVIGDLINVMKVSRECFIALIRLDLMPGVYNYPIVEADMPLALGQAKSPFPGLLRKGYAPRFRAYLAERNIQF